MQVDCLVFGRIKSVSKFHIDVCLPHGQTGRVNIYDISDKYTELLKEIISSGEAKENVATLEQLFNVGQFVRGCIKNSSTDTGENAITAHQNVPVELSLNPKLVNKGVLKKHLKLKNWFVGAVVTEEDHGYTVDLGVSDVECFLPRSRVTEKIYLGQLITVLPAASDAINFAASEKSRVLTVSPLSEIPSDLVLDPSPSIHFGSLLPGTWIRGEIHGRVSSTLVVKFCDYFISVNRAHYKDSVEYAQNKEVVLSLLIVDPGTKQLTGSLLPHLLPPKSTTDKTDRSCEEVSIGSRFPGAVIERVDKRTIHVRLDNTNGVHGVIRKAHVPEALKCDNLKTKFAVGQKVNCRVIDHDLLENVAVATMKKKLIRIPYLSIDELTPGDKVNAEVIRFTKTGVVVRVEDRLNGLIPFLHLADTPLLRPSEKFTRGQKIDCRVLVVDKASSKLILTAKRGLVEATCPIFGSKEMFTILSEAKFLQDSSDQLFAAFVAKITERGMLLIGLDGLRAWMPKKETGLSDDDVLEATFFHGQVLRVRIVRSLKQKTEEGNADDNSRSKYLVSLKLKGSDEPVKKSRILKASIKVSVGQLYNTKISRITKTGLLLHLFVPEDPAQIDGQRPKKPQPVGTGFLRFEHLTDSESNVPLLTQCVCNLKSGTPLTVDGTDRKVVMIGQTGKMALVSAKPMLLHAAEELKQSATSATSDSTGFVREFTDLRVGSQWFGWVLNHVDYGVFVQFPAGIRGLVPTRLLADAHIPPKVNVADLYPPGATVVAKVVELAPSEKRRCLLSLRMMDTYVAEEHYVDAAIRSLMSWMTEQDWISTKQNALSIYRIGDVVSFRINDSDALVAIGEACKALRSTSLPRKTNWVPAIVYRENAEGVDCTPDEIYDGVVTFVDYAVGRLEVALSRWLLNSINHRKEDDEACALHSGQKVSSIALAIRHRDVVVVAFRGHAAGRLGLVPARRTFNDVVGGNAWVIGQRNQVTLRKPLEQQGFGPTLYLCTLSIYDPVSAVASYIGRSRRGSTVIAETIESVTPLIMTPGTQLSGLRLHHIAGQIIFLRLPSSIDHLVFCRAVNWDQTAKAVRAFLNHPPSQDTEIDRTATVLFAASEDVGGRGSLHSRIPEVSFLEKPHIDVGDLVCARLLHVCRDHWTLLLPGGAHGRLHVTAMLHAKQPNPIVLSSNDGNSGMVHKIKELSANLTNNRLITCRVIDKVEDAEPKHLGQSSFASYYVCTKPSVVNGGLDLWQKQTPELGVVTNAFIKMRSVHGLLVSITHIDDMLIPIVPSLWAQLRKAKIAFRVGDHLLARPIRLVENQLVGELVFAEDLPAVEEELLESVAIQLMHNVAAKTDRARKHTERINKALNSLKFYHGSTDTKILGEKRAVKDTIYAQSSPSKKSRLTDDNSDLATKEDGSDDVGAGIRATKRQKLQTSQSNESVTESFECLGTDSALVRRYANFMLPEKYDSAEPVDQNPQVTEMKEKHKKEDTVKDDLATVEWRLRETEQRKAMLAALTAEQHCLPKGALRPTTTEEFELAVRNAPSNAACWTAYMTHILSGADRDALMEARALAERGLRAIASAAGLEPGEQDLQQARLLTFYLIMEAKELERCAQQKETHTLYHMGSDPVLEMNDQANRMSQVLSRLVNLDQVPFTRKAIETLTDIGQFDRAEDLARRLIKSSPLDVDRWLSLIRVRFRGGRIAAAREAQRNGISIVRSSQLSRFLSGAARLEFEYGDADRSLTLFREQLSAHPKQRIVYEEFIKVLLLAGKKSEANSIRETAKEKLKPHEYEAIEALFQTPSTSST